MTRPDKRGIAALWSADSTAAPLQRRSGRAPQERLSQGFALVLLGLFPLLIGPKTYYNITEVKFYGFCVLTGAYAVLCVLVCLAFPPRRSGGGEAPARRFTAPQWILMAYMLWGVISALHAHYRAPKEMWLGQSRYEGLLSLLLYGVIFLLLSLWGEYTEAYIWVLALTAIPLGLVALLQSFGVNLLYPGQYTYWTSGFLTTIGHEDCVAGLVSILVPLLFAGFVVLESRWRYVCLPGVLLLTYIQLFADVDTGKVGLLGALVVTLPWLVESRRRMSRTLICGGVMAGAFTLHALLRVAKGGAVTVTAGASFFAFLAAAAILCLGGWLLGRGQRAFHLPPSRLRRITALALAVLAVLALAAVYFYTGGNKLIGEFRRLLHGDVADELGTYRGYIWKAAVALIAEMPFTGSGPGTFYRRFMPYNEGYQVYYPTKEVDFAHNDLLQIGVCLGLVGLALYMAFLVFLAIRAIRAADGGGAAVVLMAGVLGYLIYSFFVFSIAIVSPLFWALAGLLDKYARQLEAAREIPPPDGLLARRRKKRK